MHSSVPLTPYTWAEKFESFERINSIRETNGNFDWCKSCKRLGTSRLHELHESKFPFVSRIEFIRSKLSIFSAHVYGVIVDAVGVPGATDLLGGPCGLPPPRLPPPAGTLSWKVAHRCITRSRRAGAARSADTNRAAGEPRAMAADIDPGHMNRIIRKFLADKFDTWHKRKFWLMQLLSTVGNQPFTQVAWGKISVCVTYRIYPFGTFELFCSCVRGHGVCLPPPSARSRKSHPAAVKRLALPDPYPGYMSRKERKFWTKLYTRNKRKFWVV